VRALERLSAANIDVGINVMPVLPGITDRPAMLDAVVRRVKEAGASHINACALRLQSAARKRYLPFIESEFPKLYPAYRSAFSVGPQMGDAYREGLSRFMRERCKKHGITYGSYRRIQGQDQVQIQVQVQVQAQVQAQDQIELGLGLSR